MRRKVSAFLLLSILFVSFTCSFVGFTVQASGENWWSTNFAYRKQITLNNSAVSENLVNFTLPVVFNSSQTDFWSHANSTTGSDIRFVDADNTTELYYEIAQFNGTSQNSVFWVKIPQIDSGSTTDFLWIYYGNSTVGFDAYNSPSNVWDVNAALVSHMNDVPDTSHIMDSSLNGNNGTKAAAGNPATTALGKMGNAQTFNGASSYINHGNTASLNLTFPFTISVWTNQTTTAGYQTIVSKGESTAVKDHNYLIYDYSAYIIAGFGDGTNYLYFQTTASPVSSSCWQLISVVFTSASNITVYDNATAYAGSYSGTATIATPNNKKCLLGASTITDEVFNGLIDEFRLSTVARSANWIKAEYQYELDQTKFTFAVEETILAAPEYDHVDLQSNVDAAADVGSHSNFTTQQYTDLINDTLTEADTSIPTTTDVFTSGFEEGPWNASWNDNDASLSWRVGTNSTPGSPWVTHSGTNMSFSPYVSTTAFNLTSDDINVAGAISIGISFWYMVDDEEATDFRFYYYDGSTYNLQTLDLGLAATEDTWYKYSEVVTASQYLKSNFRLRFWSLPETGEASFVDDVLINKTVANPTNYELDIEEQFTNANFSRVNAELCILMGTMNGETLLVQWWNATSSTWLTIIASLTASQWNNVSVTAYLTSATFTIKFVDGTKTTDTTQTSWNKDSCLLHTWDAAAAGLAVTLGQNILLPAYNALAKGLGFQTTNTVIPSSTGYFWKALPFQLTGTTKLFESTNLAKALGFLSSGVVGFFSSTAKTVGLAFRPTASALPSSSNYFFKAIGFQTTNTVQSFSSVAMQKALGFLTSGVSSLFASLSKVLGLGFQSGNSIFPSGTSYLSKALGFQSSALIVPSSVSYFRKALGFQATDMIRAFDSSSMLKGLGFLPTEFSNIFDGSAMAKAVGFQALEVQRSENIFPSSASYFWKAIGFQSTNTINVYDALGMGRELGFSVTGVVNGFSILLKGMSLSFQSSGSIRLWDSSVMLKALGYQAVETTRIFDSATMLNAFGFLTTGTTNFYSSLSKAMELAFTPTSILYPVAYGTSGKETATILVDRFELAKLFDNVDMLKALSFRTTASLHLFDSSMMSKAITLLSTGTFNVFDAATMLNTRIFLTTATVNPYSSMFRGIELGFSPSDIIYLHRYGTSGKETATILVNAFDLTKVCSSVLGGIEVAFQSSGTVKLWDSNVILKALGFRVTEASKLFDSSTMLKALAFLTSNTINIVDSLSASFEIWQYVPQDFYFTLTDIAKMFSDVSFNMAKGFGNYGLIQPSSSIMQGKGLQFSVDELIRLFSEASLGIGKAFSNFASLNPVSSIIENKALGFNAYGLSQFFDNLGMGKSIRITTFAFLNAEQIRFTSTLTMGKEIFIQFSTTLFGNLNIQGLMIPVGQIVLTGPSIITVSGFWKILALFSIIMLIIVIPYGFLRRRKPEDDED